MKWPKLTERAVPDTDLAPPEASLDAASRAVADVARLPDTTLEVMPRDLAKEEQSALRRISPWRDRWPELDQMDDRVAELDRRRQGMSGELQRLREEHNRAPDVDAQALAAWFQAGEKGTRPEPIAPKLKRQIEDKQREHDALLQAAEAVLADRVRYVERHRKRLASEVAKKKEEKRERYEALVAELARTREALRAARADEVWAQLYPSRAAQAAPPTPLAGGRGVAGIEPQLRPEQVFELLKKDAEFLSTALTQEQAEEMGLKRQDKATWLDTPEGIERDRKDKREQLEAHKRMFGTYPA